MIKCILSAVVCAAVLLSPNAEHTESAENAENMGNAENHISYTFRINDSFVGFNTNDVGIYDDIVSSEWQDFTIYDSSELTLEDFENRNGRKIIERVFALVTSHDGKATQLNGGEWYISYENLTEPRVSEGTVMLSYFVYNPDSNFCDDFLQRYDFVLSREYED